MLYKNIVIGITKMYFGIVGMDNESIEVLYIAL